MHDPFQPSISINDGKRSDFLLFHQSESGGSEFVRRDGFRVASPQFAGRQVEHILSPLLEQAPQVPIADDAQ